MTTTLSLKVLRSARRCNYATLSTSKTATCLTVVPNTNRKCLHFETWPESKKLCQLTVSCGGRSSRAFGSNAAQAQTECPHFTSSNRETEVKAASSTITTETLINDEWDKALPYEDIPGPKPMPILGNTWR